MKIELVGAPCSWGVDDLTNPDLPSWERVLQEAAQAGYRGIELGPYGYIPLDSFRVQQRFLRHQLHVVAGTIFDDLVSEVNFHRVLAQVDDICTLLTHLPSPRVERHIRYPGPYLVLIDWRADERDLCAGHPREAPRLPRQEWKRLMTHLQTLATRAWSNFGIRAVIHPHAGGYIEFEDEIHQLLNDVPYDVTGLCLDTGHLYYSQMDPAQWLQDCAPRLDYIHFKDINVEVYERVIAERMHFFDACKQGVMCPIGRGVLDYMAINQALVDIHYQGYVTVEQERDPQQVGEALVDIRKSLAYLKSQGF